VIQLSVNINKVATLRNSRGGHTPSVLDATRACIVAGAPGVTVHPRADARHITERDVREVSALLRNLVELYTEPFARAFERGPEAARDSFRVYAAAAECAHSLGLGVNAGHDLDLENLVLFRTLPHLAEASIGHALISHALFVGLDRSVREYLSVLRGA
jgi:pyridoxine 5'-phosphate synthase PdxJ